MSFIIKAQGKDRDLYFIRFTPEEEPCWTDWPPGATHFKSKEIAEQWAQRLREGARSGAKVEVIEK